MHTTTHTKHHSSVFIWMHTCQHTQVSVFILGCLLSLWMFDMLPCTWHYFFLFFFSFRNNRFPAMPGSSEGSVDRLCDLCDGLHSTLAEADMLGRRCKRRSGILRTLFHLIDLNSAQLDLHIAKLCLAVSLLCPRGCVGVSMSAAKSLSQGHAGLLGT